jgi:hypothetical protein
VHEQRLQQNLFLTSPEILVLEVLHAPVSVSAANGDEHINLTMKYYFDVIEMNYAANLFVSNVDALGEIKKHPSALKDAFRLGCPRRNKKAPFSPQGCLPTRPRLHYNNRPAT